MCLCECGAGDFIMFDVVTLNIVGPTWTRADSEKEGGSGHSVIRLISPKKVLSVILSIEFKTHTHTVYKLRITR